MFYAQTISLLRMFRNIFFAGFLALAFSAFAQNDISKIDKNFAVEKADGLDVVYHNAATAPFVVEGFAWRKDGGSYSRLPKNLDANEVNRGARDLSSHSAGGVVRFRTDSPYIVLRAEISSTYTMGHMADTGSSGFDFFCDTNRYLKTVNPRMNKPQIPTPVVAVLTQNFGKKMRDYSLYMPLYNGVKKLEIGLAPDAKFEKPTPHKIAKPILFYGSSITQGGCASRTSNVYTAMLCRALDAPMINLGFSGSAKGEPKLAELIASLDLAAFVYDYDYNAPTTEHLKKTHEPFFKIIRKAKPNLPIIMLSRVSYPSDDRVAVIRATYENAKKAGDKNVYFIDGRDLFKDADISYLTVDGCHPNDLGFYLMFKNTLPTLKQAIGVK